jgi:hypothetical protein
MNRPAYLYDDDDFGQVVKEERRRLLANERVDQSKRPVPARAWSPLEGKRAEDVAVVAIVANEEVPLDLFPPVPGATPFPVDTLGPLQSAAEAIAGMCQTPLALAAQSSWLWQRLPPKPMPTCCCPLGRRGRCRCFL